MQRFWDLNKSIKNRKETITNIEEENNFSSKLKLLINKIDNSINDFRFNVSIASFYEIYNHFNFYIKKNLSNKILEDYIIIINKLMLPIVPHLANECLELYNCKDIDLWPKIKKDTLEEIDFAVQVNGKTRDIIKIKKDIIEKEVNQIVLSKSKAKKYFDDKEILRTIFVKNKIINYIIKT